MSARDDYTWLTIMGASLFSNDLVDDANDALDEIDRLRDLHRASCDGCPRMPQCWEAANLKVEAS